MTISPQTWNVLTPEEVGMDAKILALADREILAKYSNVLSMLIVRDGSIVYERYYRNIDPEEPVSVMSVNKSILSTLYGIALDKQVLSSLDQLVVEFFPEINDRITESRVRCLTLRHLLTMSSGFYYLRLSGDAQPIWHRTILSRNWVEYSLNLPVRDAMGMHFNYKNTDAFLAAACLSRVTGVPIGEIAEEWLFKPLDLTIPNWIAEDPQGLGFGTLCMTARDMAKIGLLYLQDGIWGENQIISREWVKESTSRQIGNYGYLWWAHNDGFSASGAGGALIRVIPAQRLVVVFQSKHLKRFKDPREIVDRFVIPSIIK